MFSLLRNQRLRLLIVGIAIAFALTWAALATRYPSGYALGSTSGPSTWSRIINIGAVRDPIGVEALLPVDDAVLNFEELSNHHSGEQWAAVESTAAKSVSMSPLNSRMWLVLAMARAAQHSAIANVAAALKMSYYTAPNDVTIMEPRLLFSVQLDFASDPELTAAIRRELRNIFLGPTNLRTIFTHAYCHAVPRARVVIDDVARGLQRTSGDAWYLTC
jgi:hypothetical protein